MYVEIYMRYSRIGYNKTKCGVASEPIFASEWDDILCTNG